MTVRKSKQDESTNGRFFEAIAFWMQAKKMRVGLHPGLVIVEESFWSLVSHWSELSHLWRLTNHHGEACDGTKSFLVIQTVPFMAEDGTVQAN